MQSNPPSDGPSWTGPRGETPSFPRRGKRGVLLLAAAATISGIALVVVGFSGTGGLSAAQLGVGSFSSVMGALAMAGARRLRTCASCGAQPRVATGKLPLAAADQMITAIELADPDRLGRIDGPSPGEPVLSLELLHCPRCRDLGWLRATSRVQGVPVRIGPTWVLLGSFLVDVLAELRRR